MDKFKLVDGVKVMEGSKTYELLSSKNPDDQKKAARLSAYARKAEKVNYDATIIAKLRQEYSDVL